MKMRNILLLLINFLFISTQTTSDKFINEEVTRKINLKNKILYFQTNIQIQNKHTSPLNSYTYLLSKNNSQHLIHFSVKLNGKNCITKQKDEDSNYIYYTISFDPIDKDETKTLSITEHYFESLSFLPKKITIKEDQLSLFQDTGNLPSIYETKNTIKPLKSYPIKIHYINNNPYIIMNHASKTYQVSHWGNIAVTEDYQMENIGAKLDGEFGRIDYNQYSNKGGKNALKKFRAILPLRAWGLWYRDEIGNISSSNAIREWDDVKLDLVPRFPILGGWKSNFGIGYNLPSKFHVNTDNNGNYVVNLTFGMPYSDLLARNYTVEVILPEGADDIKVNLNTDGKFDVVKNKFYGCLDLFGRNSVIIHMRNVYDIHKVYFQIRYKYSNALLFVKPVILIVYFFFIFVALILYSRGNLSLKKDSKVKVE